MFFKAQAPASFDFETVWAVTLAVGVVPFLAWWTGFLRLPPCNMQRLAGLPCPTCGTSRTVRLLLDGELAAAFFMSPAAFLGIGVMLLYSIYAVTVVAGRLPRLRLVAGGKPWKFVLIMGGVLVLANWGYLVYRQFG